MLFQLRISDTSKKDEGYFQYKKQRHQCSYTFNETQQAQQKKAVVVLPPFIS